MAKYTIVINAENDNEMGIQYAAEKQARETGFFLNSADFLQRVMDNTVERFAREYLEFQLAELAPKFVKASDGIRNVVKSALASVQPPPEEAALAETKP